MSVQQRSFLNGVIWSFIDNFSGTGINFVVGILLARQLMPEEFGLVGIALFMVALSIVIVEGGFSNALIRKTEVTDLDYATTFTINLSTAVGIYLLFYISAPWVATFYRLPDLEAVIRTIGVVIIIAGCAIVPKVRFTKNFDFRSQALASLISSTTGAAVALYMVYHGYGIWSMVFQQIVRQTLYTTLIWGMLRIWPRLAYSAASARALFSFGSRLLICAFLDNLYNNLLYSVIGKVYSPRQLGLYTRAEQFSSTLSVNFTSVMQRVSLPRLAQHKEDAEAFSEIFRRQLRFAILFSTTLCLGTCAMADHLVLALIGEHWLEAILPLRILCLAAIVQPLIGLHQNVLQAHGCSQLYLRLEIGKKIFAVSIVVLGLWTSFHILLWGMVVIALGFLWANHRFNRRYLPTYPPLLQLRDVVEVMLPLALWCVFIYAVGQFLTAPAGAMLLFQSILLLIGTLGVFRLFHPEDFHRLSERLRYLRHRIRRL